MFDRPRLIPCLLLDGQNLVKTKKFKEPQYLGDPINAVRIFNEKEVDELCILDITRNRREIDFDFLSNLATEAFMPLSYGGGIESLDAAKRLFHIGFEKVVINTSIVINPEIVKKIVKFAGSQSVVASIDVKRSFIDGYQCFIKNGEQKTKYRPVELAVYAEELGVGEILINSIDRDGMMQGYDLHLISDMSNRIGVPLISCGGAGSLDDLRKAIEAGADAVAAGSIFVYYGAKKAVLINYPSQDELISAGIFKPQKTG